MKNKTFGDVRRRRPAHVYLVALLFVEEGGGEGEPVGAGGAHGLGPGLAHVPPHLVHIHKPVDPMVADPEPDLGLFGQIRIRTFLVRSSSGTGSGSYQYIGYVKLYKQGKII